MFTFSAGLGGGEFSLSFLEFGSGGIQFRLLPLRPPRVMVRGAI